MVIALWMHASKLKGSPAAFSRTRPARAHDFKLQVQAPPLRLRVLVRLAGLFRPSRLSAPSTDHRPLCLCLRVCKHHHPCPPSASTPARRRLHSLRKGTIASCAPVSSPHTLVHCSSTRIGRICSGSLGQPRCPRTMLLLPLAKCQ
jgi:hypothetical protein